MLQGLFFVLHFSAVLCLDFWLWFLVSVGVVRASYKTDVKMELHSTTALFISTFNVPGRFHHCKLVALKFVGAVSLLSGWTVPTM